jgi:hypothetical protein
MAGREFRVKTAVKDFFTENTLPVLEWIGAREGTEALKAWSEFMGAVKAVMTHDWFEWELREEPHVGYDIKHDENYFIFKIDNNGTTFVVSQFDMEVD